MNGWQGRQRSAAPQDFPCVNAIQKTIIRDSYSNRETCHAFGPPHNNSGDHCHCRSRADHGKGAKGNRITAPHLLPTSAESVQAEILNGTLSAYTKARLKAECARIVKQGYAECDQEIHMGVSSVAAPVQIGRIGAAFSVGAIGPVRRLEASDRKKIGEELIQGRR